MTLITHAENVGQEGCMAESKGWESSIYRAAVSVLKHPGAVTRLQVWSQCASKGAAERSIAHSPLLLVVWFAHAGEHQPMSPYMDTTPPQDLGHLCHTFAVLAARVERCAITAAQDLHI